MPLQRLHGRLDHPGSRIARIGTSLMDRYLRLTSTLILLHADLASTYVLVTCTEGILMPITVTAREASSPQLASARSAAADRGADRGQRLTGNSFFTSIVGGTVHILAPEDIYAGGANRPSSMVELKLANIGLPTTEARAAFIAAATGIVDALTIPGMTGRTPGSTSSTLRRGLGIGGIAYTGDDSSPQSPGRRPWRRTANSCTEHTTDIHAGMKPSRRLKERLSLPHTRAAPRSVTEHQPSRSQ